MPYLTLDETLDSWTCQRKRTVRAHRRRAPAKQTAPWPELLVLGGLAPAAWPVFYVWLLVRRGGRPAMLNLLAAALRLPEAELTRS